MKLANNVMNDRETLMTMKLSLVAGWLAVALASAPLAATFAEPTTAPTTSPTTTAAPADLTAPTRITLKMDDAGVEDVMAALSKQSGYSLRPFNRAMWNMRGARPTISVDYQNTTFWETLADFCQKSQLTPYFNDGSGQQMLFIPTAQMGASVFNCPRSGDGGATLAILTQISRQSSVNLGTGLSPGNNSFSARLSVLVEPKLRLLGYYYVPKIDEAVDDNGNSLLPGGDQGSGGLNSASRQLQVTEVINLRYPKTHAGSKITRLRGAVRLKVATQIENAEFTNVLGDKEQSATTPSGRRITLRSVKATDAANLPEGARQYLVQVTVYRDQSDQQKFNDLSNNAGLHVLDAQNRELQFQMNKEVVSNGNKATLSLMYYRRSPEEGGGALGEPARVVWDVILDSKDISIPFEFKDVPMP